MAFKQDDQTDDIFDSYMPAPPVNQTLVTINQLIDWKPLREKMAVAYSPKMGRKGFDPVLLFKILLLQMLYQMSDPSAVEEVADRNSFRKFLGLGPGARIPEATTLVKFRNRLREANLLDALFAEITAQMSTKGLRIKQGSLQLVDATIIAAAPVPPAKDTPAEKKKDPDAGFTRKNGKYHYGYKLHVAQDRNTGLITGHKTTSARVHDSQVFEELIPQQAGHVMADKAYDNNRIRQFCKDRKIKDDVMQQARRKQGLTHEQKQENLRISKVRSFVEGVPATLKRYLRCARALYIGLDRTRMQFTLAVLAFNMKRFSALLQENCT